MQKKLIALAVAAAFSAPALAETNVYGIADLAIANFSGTNGGTNVISGGLSTSRFGVKHTEGLDNGMTAVVVLEYALDVANKTALGSSSSGAVNARQQMLALAGDFGTVAAGFLQTAGYDFAVKFDPTAGAAVDTAAYVNTTVVSAYINTSARAPHAAAYISPDLNGLKIAVNHAFDATNVNNTAPKITANLLSATYSAGPLAVGGVYAADDVAAGKTTEYGLGASYALPVATLFGSYNSSKTGAASAKTALAFHAVAPVSGVGTVVFTYGKNDLKGAAANRSGFTLALLRDLSKTTTAYGALEKQTVSGGTDTTIVAVGLRKKF